MSSPKETNFFIRGSDRDLDWYRQCFSGEARAYGETSTNYAKHPGFEGVPEQMHGILPDIRLLYLVRDPVERAISHYVHNWVNRRESDLVEEALCPPEESWYVNVSRYYYQISQYLGHYSPEDIRIVESERLREERMEVLSEIFEFIGVNPSPNVESQEFQIEHHKSDEKQKPTGAAYFLKRTDIGRALKEVGKAIVPRPWVEYSKELLWEDVEKPTVSRDVRERVRSFLKGDLEELRRLTGREFTSWSL
jgi:hypothetical protein